MSAAADEKQIMCGSYLSDWPSKERAIEMRVGKFVAVLLSMGRAWGQKPCPLNPPRLGTWGGAGQATIPKSMPKATRALRQLGSARVSALPINNFKAQTPTHKNC
ncbi:uncharacterized protein PGTG_19213 [Puccinia graminis f. sp. tritici CRL 75-36-700-3]|uniref:Uncharacterized protein n=1 Tax=Puccinia graminis f. sp. tritici (strain CRL 75-36-700-3 / race SCCL) TaxID=418459 RepID=E3L983_PUCGT|nr:uncharacterized protein PGTG_19213 [Puccinia graminis f. sp. tritici CRL 75-36-700-3]EFP93108.1 hypothetical protein PGTG_19213 [Puccinia graminis f. sp. tritici CRL 75-36-700-3]